MRLLLADQRLAQPTESAHSPADTRQNAQRVQVRPTLPRHAHIARVNQPQTRQNPAQQRILTPPTIQRFLIGQFLVQQHFLIAGQALVKRRRLQQVQLLRVRHVRAVVPAHFAGNARQLRLSASGVGAHAARARAATRGVFFGGGGAFALLHAQAEYLAQARVAGGFGVARAQFEAGVVGAGHVALAHLPLYRGVGGDRGVDFCRRGVVLYGLEGEGELAQVDVRPARRHWKFEIEMRKWDGVGGVACLRWGWGFEEDYENMWEGFGNEEWMWI